jgi:hypothetical protein
MWIFSIRNLPIAFLHNLRYLSGNNHATSPVITFAPQKEPLASKRPCLYSTQQWLHETNRPPPTPLDPPARRPTETAITPTLDDYAPALPDENDGNAPTFAPPQAPLWTSHGQPLPPSAYRITTDTPSGASAITCPLRPQTPNPRLTAPCLTSASYIQHRKEQQPLQKIKLPIRNAHACAAPTPWAYPRTFGPGDVHGVLRDFKLAAPAEGYFFSRRGLRQMFAKYYFNNPTHVTLPQSSRASCLGIVSLGAHSQVAAAA